MNLQKKKKIQLVFIKKQNPCQRWSNFHELYQTNFMEGIYYLEVQGELFYFFKFKMNCRTSLVAQWLRICLPMQGARVRALVREDPTCRGASKPVHRNYWACALQPASHHYWAHVLPTTEAHMPRARAPQQEKPPQWEAGTLQWRVAPARCN